MSLARLHFKGNTGSEVEIQLPGSKSISNRFLIIRNLANSSCEFQGLSNARDTRLLFDSLNNPTPSADFQDGATPYRFFTAWAAAKNMSTSVTGSTGLEKRSIEPLVNSLKSLGADIEYLHQAGYAPVKIKKGISHFKEVVVDHSQSSQFASALMLIAPIFPGEKVIHLTGSHEAGFGYLETTASCMRQAGVSTKIRQDQINIREGQYALPAQIGIEADWSSAAWFYMLCACMPEASFKMPRLQQASYQEDSQLATWFAELGVKTTFNESGIQIRKNGVAAKHKLHFDFKNNIDLAPALICTCAFLKLKATFWGLENLKFKESDRLKGLQKNLAQLGISLSESPAGWNLNFSRVTAVKELRFDTANDHRMVMAFSVFALRQPIYLNWATCVEKSFPNYWKEMEKCNFVIQHGA